MDRCNVCRSPRRFGGAVENSKTQDGDSLIHASKRMLVANMEASASERTRNRKQETETRKGRIAIITKEISRNAQNNLRAETCNH